VDREGNAYDTCWLALSVYQSSARTYDVLQVILNSDVQADLIAREQLDGVRLNVSWGVDGTDGVDYVLPGSG